MVLAACGVVVVGGVGVGDGVGVGVDVGVGVVGVVECCCNLFLLVL